MAKIGSILQETRLSKGLTLDSIADETNIGVRFLLKLENDDYSGFPGEPYIIGFIRNYAEYLGLNAEALVNRYRSREDAAEAVLPFEANPAERPAAPETTESPEIAVLPEKPEEPRQPEQKSSAKSSSRQRKKKDAPLEALEPQKPSEKAELPAPKNDGMDTGAGAPGRSVPPLRNIVLGLLVVLIIGSAVLWIFVGGRLQNNKTGGPDSAKPAEYKVEGGDFQKRLYTGDILLIPFAEDVYRISLGTIGETVILETPFGSKELRLGETAELDPDANDTPDILLVLEDFQKDRPASGALLRVSFNETDTAESARTGEVTVPRALPPSTAVKDQDTVILRSTRGPYPFIVQVSFRGNCLFRYEADRKEWVEKYYSKGESININVTNALTLWSSNAQAAKLTVQASGGRSVDLEIGGPGEIAVKRLAWSKADSANWALSSSELD
jgi:cytoskeletal protein RodZ